MDETDASMSRSTATGVLTRTSGTTPTELWEGVSAKMWEMWQDGIPLTAPPSPEGAATITYVLTELPQLWTDDQLTDDTQRYLRIIGYLQISGGPPTGDMDWNRALLETLGSTLDGTEFTYAGAGDGSGQSFTGDYTAAVTQAFHGPYQWPWPTDPVTDPDAVGGYEGAPTEPRVTPNVTETDVHPAT